MTPGPWFRVDRISTKWIFKVKTKEDGSTDRYKAHLVANGMRLVHNMDYLDTFSPVVQPLSIRLVLGLAISNGWSIHQSDVSNAFLHDRLNERIVVAQPPGFHDTSSLDHVCLLHKSLYGLKQSPQCWLQKLREVLYKFGLTESRVDPSVFISKQGAPEFHLCVYLDDIIIASPDEQEIQCLLTIMGREFLIRDLGDLRFFLGIQVSLVEERLYL